MKYPLTITTVIVLVIAGATLYHSQRRADILSFDHVPTPVAEGTDSREPIHISIPDINIDIPVEPGFIEQEIWSISEDRANHLTTSAHPGSEGNTIIYGHNKQSIFGRLSRANVDDLILVTDANGDIHHYTVTEMLTVSPDDASAVQQTDEETLTVYTCTGFLNSKRLIVRAQPI